MKMKKLATQNLRQEASREEEAEKRKGGKD